MIDTADLSELSSKAFRLLLNDFIEQRLQTKDFEVNINSATKKGDNFIGVVQRVSYKKNSSNVRSFLIFKTAPTNEARRQQFFSRKFFLREIHAYNEVKMNDHCGPIVKKQRYLFCLLNQFLSQVLPILKEFQQLNGANIELNDFSGYPECYESHVAERNECLFLEDLTTKGFSMIDRRNETISAEHVNLVMKSIGKLHAISFALRDQQPEKFREIVLPLTDLFMNQESELFKVQFEKMKSCVLGCLSADNDSFLIERLNRLYEKSNFEIAAECVNGALAEPYGVVCHGDCWTNNTMFKYDETNKPTDVCLVDWQILRYCSPVTDLVYYIFLCTTKEMRDVHYDTFLSTYYESLSSHLRR